MWLSLAPVLTFWLAALSFYGLGWDSPAHRTAPSNRVTVRDTVVRMLQIDMLHVASALPMEYGWLLPAQQVHGAGGVRLGYVLGGIFLLDTIEYFYHAIQHKVPWLYRRFHQEHHAMRYSFGLGSFYNSFSDVLFVGPLVGVFFLGVFRFTFVELQAVTCLAVLWTVMDHTEAFDRVGWLGRKDFHRIHHQVNVNCNFQQPFMTFWDTWLGTDYASVQRQRQPEHANGH